MQWERTPLQSLSTVWNVKLGEDIYGFLGYRLGDFKGTLGSWEIGCDGAEPLTSALEWWVLWGEGPEAALMSKVLVLLSKVF